eukprot:421672_1
MEDLSLRCNFDNTANNAILHLYRYSTFSYNNEFINLRDHYYDYTMYNNVEMHNWDDLFDDTDSSISIESNSNKRRTFEVPSRRQLLNYDDYWNIDFEGALQTLFTNIFDFIWLTYCPYLDRENLCDEYIHIGYRVNVFDELKHGCLEVMADIFCDILNFVGELFLGDWTAGIDGVCIKYNGIPKIKLFTVKEKNDMDGKLGILFGLKSLIANETAIEIEVNAWIRNKWCIGVIFGEWCLRDRRYHVQGKVASNPEIVTTFSFGIENDDFHFTLNDININLNDFDCDIDIDWENIFILHGLSVLSSPTLLLPGWLAAVGWTFDFLAAFFLPVVAETIGQNTACPMITGWINEQLDTQMVTFLGDSQDIQIWRGDNVIPGDLAGLIIRTVWKDLSWDYSLEIQFPDLCYQGIVDNGLQHLIATGDPNAGFSVCFREIEQSSQCQGTRNSCSGYSGLPSFTKPYLDDTDTRSGGCKYQYKLLPGIQVNTDHEYRICFYSYGSGWNNGQCAGTKFSCSGWASNIEPTPIWTKPFIDNTNDLPGGCFYEWLTLSRVKLLQNANTKSCRVCFKQLLSNYRCYPFGPVCSAWSNDPDWSEYYWDDTDRSPHYCIYQWRIECSANNEHAIKPEKMQIFGAAFGPKDVTNELNELCIWNREGTKLEIKDTIFDDSWYGIRKTIVISFGMYDKKNNLLGVGMKIGTDSIIVDEKSYYGYHPNLNIKNKVVVLGAAYGLADITEKMQEMVKDMDANSLNVDINQLDDGFYQNSKTLVIVYSYNGIIDMKIQQVDYTPT